MLSLRFRSRVAALVLAAIAIPATAVADAPGTIVGVTGTAEVGRGDPVLWVAVTAGQEVHAGDRLRTGPDGAIRLLLVDGSLISLGEDSTFELGDIVFQADRGRVRVLLNLITGKLRTLVSEYYDQRNASFEVTTPTAISGVRGTDFIVRYDSADRLTEVVGIAGSVAVGAVDGEQDTEVLVLARMRTRVRSGEAPSMPEVLPERLFRQYLDGLELIGGGDAGLAASDAVPRGGEVHEPERLIDPNVPQLEPEEPALSDPVTPLERFPRSPGDATEHPVPVIELPGELEIPL